MDKLLVTPSEVNEKAKEVTNIKETMLTHLDSIKTRIQNLTESDWVGAAGVAYQNQFTHLYNQAIIALETLQQHANNPRREQLRGAGKHTGLGGTESGRKQHFLQVILRRAAVSAAAFPPRRTHDEGSDRHHTMPQTV